MSEDITCPFCGETNFDLIGLKNHLLNYCEPFEKIVDVHTDIQQRIREHQQKGSHE